MQQWAVIDGTSQQLLNPVALDEQAVNTHLIELPNALTFFARNDNRIWSAQRRRFVVDFGTVNGQRRRFVACTDGQLEDRDTRDVKAIIECKQDERPIKTEKQETAEIVAWIKQHPDQNQAQVNQ